MIIQIGTKVDESRILWKHKESDEWKRADIDDLIYAYEVHEDRPKGEWILHGEPPIYVRECPKCGAKYHHAKEWGEVNYCSNCGCDCRGDKE